MLSQFMQNTQKKKKKIIVSISRDKEKIHPE